MIFTPGVAPSPLDLWFPPLVLNVSTGTGPALDVDGLPDPDRFLRSASSAMRWEDRRQDPRGSGLRGLWNVDDAGFIDEVGFEGFWFQVGLAPLGPKDAFPTAPLALLAEKYRGAAGLAAPTSVGFVITTGRAELPRAPYTSLEDEEDLLTGLGLGDASRLVDVSIGIQDPEDAGVRVVAGELGAALTARSTVVALDAREGAGAVDIFPSASWTARAEQWFEGRVEVADPTLPWLGTETARVAEHLVGLGVQGSVAINWKMPAA